MADTGIVGPLANTAVGTGLGDGTNYGAWSSPQRLHRNGIYSNAAVVTAANKGTRWYNCFDNNQIPAGATITGVEIVATTDFDGSGNSNIGTFGSTGSTESISMRAYLYNGSSYSSPLAYDGATRTGITYSDSNTTATFLGPNRRYLGSSTLGTLFGGSSDLSGLTWDPANQANFGFVFTSTAIVNTPVAGAIRGIGLRVTYTEAVARSGPADVAKINGVATADIDKFSGVAFDDIGKFRTIS